MKLRLLTILSLCLFAVPTFAQDAEKKAESTTEKAADKAKTEAEKAKDEAEEAEDEVRESADGAYEWKRSYGIGLDLGLWFSDFDRWEICAEDRRACFLRGQNDLVADHSTTWNLDLVIEASLLEGTRLSIFGGIQTPLSSEPTIRALYVGIEPAFAFRRDMWEIALGIGLGLGSAKMEHDSGEVMDAGLTLLRPFIELRRYLNEWSAVYGRFGFNEWIIKDPELENLELAAADHNLNTGGIWISIGARFGHYPLHVKKIGDDDGDGIKNDIDDCPNEAEDIDEFEDGDGCPEADNDNDGIEDKADKCPLQPEDKDGWQDEDGCPESDDDSDGDGLLNTADKCPNDAEDKDGFQDDDGCPDPDNDGDGILDTDDKCPEEAGVPEKQGCPFRLVEVTEKAINLNEKIFFEYNKAKIKKESYPLLNEVANVLKQQRRITKVEIGGHTDHSGSARYNERLSGKRAEAVMNYLVGQGVEPPRLTSKGYGFRKPLVPLEKGKKESKEAAEKNRRVEITILEQTEVKKTVREDQVKEGETQTNPK